MLLNLGQTMKIPIHTCFSQFHVFLRLTVLMLSLGLVCPVFANEPGEAVKCTNLAKSGWVGEQKIRQVFDENKYIKVFLKVSRGSCYEFYAIGKDNSVTEAYYDPISTELMQSTHIAADGKITSYERPNASVQPAKRDNPKKPTTSASSAIKS
jgi:hypothetical protein